ncbi:ribosomal-protein-alanine N-acetyltransferase [Asanoa ishikariensis]|uniref:Protein N-acetyltransferase, RimJ/RimL family n=1 Tax=Asanoa ishikariensis TaxID=137265 RepID=A0A1H3RPQ4_9ACTN|nr:GNAT family protein [Asanoa ishikariensis]GIF67020.1 ribosomal-protein-alanine N-acetyltransferase [Asanoa ishikariensis]SDZ27191.1 Protein N-acetyltransferase, RimJ/RimL family [Asanoa ishikariensis]
MLRGEKVLLRARHDEDVPVLHADLYDDVATRSRADGRAWRPIPPGLPESPFTPSAPSADAAIFSVVRLADGELAGDALLWGIDLHNRSGHVGISLRPAVRGSGLGVDTVRVLCRYGFRVRGLHRLQLETLADNAAMVAAAERVGFRREGTLRQNSWVDGAFLDEAVFGLVADEWQG